MSGSDEDLRTLRFRMMDWLSKRTRERRRGQPLRYSRTSMAADLEVDFEECEEHGWPCDHCLGTGNAAGLGRGESCEECDGYGLVKEDQST